MLKETETCRGASSSRRVCIFTKSGERDFLVDSDEPDASTGFHTQHPPWMDARATWSHYFLFAFSDCARHHVVYRPLFGAWRGPSALVHPNFRPPFGLCLASRVVNSGALHGVPSNSRTLAMPSSLLGLAIGMCPSDHAGTAARSVARRETPILKRPASRDLDPCPLVTAPSHRRPKYRTNATKKRLPW